MSEERDRALIEQFIEAYNGFDVDGMVARVAPGIRFENYSGGRLTDSVHGIDAFRTLADVPARTPESDELSKDLKARGFRFVGSTIVYAFMQATGLEAVIGAEAIFANEDAAFEAIGRRLGNDAVAAYRLADAGETRPAPAGPGAMQW